MKEKNEWSEKEESEEMGEKMSKRRNDDEDKRKRACPKGIPPSSPPQKRTLAATFLTIYQVDCLTSLYLDHGFDSNDYLWVYDF